MNKKQLDEAINLMVKKQLKEESPEETYNKSKKVFHSKTTKGKSTGMLQIDLGQDSLGEPVINFWSNNGTAGMKKEEVVQIIKYLAQLVKGI